MRPASQNSTVRRRKRMIIIHLSSSVHAHLYGAPATIVSGGSISIRTAAHDGELPPE
jgi:hypothetical protein